MHNITLFFKVILMPKSHHKPSKMSSKSKIPAKHTAKKAHIHIKPSSKHAVKKQIKKSDKNIDRKSVLKDRHASPKGVVKSVKVAAPKVVKESLKERREKEQEVIVNEQRKHDIKVVEDVFADPHFSEHLVATMGDRSVDVVKALYKKPQTDEKLTEKLEMKINEVRRVLNMMNGHGITKYDVTKDSSGWLIFTWRVDAEKLFEYANARKQTDSVPASALPENCNDFFFCKKCYDNNTIVLPFDSAIEHSFKCVDCGSKLDMIDRQNAELFIKGLKSREVK